MSRFRSNSVKDKNMKAHKSIFILSEEEKEAHPLLRPPPVINPLVHPLKKNHFRRYLRVSSTPRLPSQEEYAK
jgi:hypothetical protein